MQRDGFLLTDVTMQVATRNRLYSKARAITVEALTSDFRGALVTAKRGRSSRQKSDHGRFSRMLFFTAYNPYPNRVNHTFGD